MNPAHSRATRLGGAAWLLAGTLFFVNQLVTQTAWTTGYSWARNNISDLGNARCATTGGRYICSPWHAVFNVSSVAIGVLLATGVVLTAAWWQRGRVTVRVLLLGAAVGYALVGLAPADLHENTHVLGAALIFFLGNAALVTIGVARRSVLTATAGALALMAAVLFLGHGYLGLGMGGMERVVVFPLPLWLIACGGLILTRGEPATHHMPRGAR